MYRAYICGRIFIQQFTWWRLSESLHTHLICAIDSVSCNCRDILPVPDDDGNTALHFAVLSGGASALACVKKLVPAPVDALDSAGSSRTYNQHRHRIAHASAIRISFADRKFCDLSSYCCTRHTRHTWFHPRHKRRVFASLANSSSLFSGYPSFVSGHPGLAQSRSMNPDIAGFDILRQTL